MYRFTGNFDLPVWSVYEVIVRLGREVRQPLPRREDDALDGLPVGVAPEEGLRGAAAAHCQPVGPPSGSQFKSIKAMLLYKSSSISPPRVLAYDELPVRAVHPCRLDSARLSRHHLPRQPVRPI